MKTICVETSKSYQVHIGHNLLLQAGEFLKTVCTPSKAAIISDSNVYPLYGKKLEDSLTASGYTVINYVFPAGESSKNGTTYLSILNFLAENEITRSDVLIALGGGVVGDVTGFAAATFLRGISYVQIPTSLLAMVDSSIGGKAAIDLPAGKNLVGAFYQPSLVICDLTTLNTLSKEIFLDGCAEVIKYGVLFDTELFEHLWKNGPLFDRESVIAQCVTLKRNVVKEDEFDTGIRQMLNLGHTVGHAIEKISDYTISHGKAVAIGMAIIAKAASETGLCDRSVCDRICKILKLFSLPTSTDYSLEALYSGLLTDKKRSLDTLNIIVPQEIGQCSIRKYHTYDIKSFIKAGL